MNSTSFGSAAAVLLLATTACGSDAPPASSPQAPVIDTTIVTDMVREPLTEDDLAGLEATDLSVELPWTSNVVSRDPGPAAPRSFVESAEISTHEGFDRVAFQLSDDAPFAGYQIRIENGIAEGRCGEDDWAVGAEDGRVLTVRLAPARTQEEGRSGPSLKERSFAFERFERGGFTCDADQTVVWATTLTAGEEVRVFEFRSPQRLVVDVR